jgi:hypothetical protein
MRSCSTSFSSLNLIGITAYFLSAANTGRATSTDCTFASSYPRQYVAYKTDHDLVIDGKLDDPAWMEVGFTEDFVDISTNTTPWLRTNAKIRWDDNYLYVGGYLMDPNVWANISFTCHCIDPNHDQVIYHDKYVNHEEIYYRETYRFVCLGTLLLYLSDYIFGCTFLSL